MTSELIVMLLMGLITTWYLTFIALGKAWPTAVAALGVIIVYLPWPLSGFLLAATAAALGFKIKKGE
jgi:hypothetical protein